MKKYLIILVMTIALVGCSSNSQAKAPDEAAVEVSAVSVQDNSQEPVSNAEETAEAGQSDNNQPAVRQGSNLELPSGFPSNIVSIVEDANITDTIVDGESFYIAYQTNKSFSEVKETYKRLMDGSKFIREDYQGDDYYTINCNKEKTNVYITVTKFSADITSVVITTNTFDLTMTETGWEMGGSSSGASGEADSTLIVPQEP